jgi:hypothetical protein
VGTRRFGWLAVGALTASLAFGGPATQAADPTPHVLVAAYGSGPAADLAHDYLRVRMSAGVFEPRALVFYWTELDGTVTVGERRAWDQRAGAVVDAVVDLVDNEGRSVIAASAAHFLAGSAGVPPPVIEQLRRAVRVGNVAMVAVVAPDVLPEFRHAFEVTGPRRLVEGPVPALVPGAPR